MEKKIPVALKRCKQTHSNSSVDGNSLELITPRVSYSSPWNLEKTYFCNKSSPPFLIKYTFRMEKTIPFALKRCKQTYKNSSVHGNSLKLITPKVSYSFPWN